ncbi:MAG TPA: hypothetical protein VE439_03355 [Anaerolineae bacterium]|jgi:hypothetical protein|nr:hypothetical protein [Anaerolineae bacterium]
MKVVIKRIRRFFSNFDDTMAAVAFAEEGELEMARQIMAESEQEQGQVKGKRIDLRTYRKERNGNNGSLRKRASTR